MAARGDAHRPKSTPQPVTAQKEAIRLLSGTLKRAHRPSKIPASLRGQLLGIAGHWFALRRRGESVMYPGISNMAEWGACKERQAKYNCRTLEAWGVLQVKAHAAGGAGLATEYWFSTDALWRILVTTGANPHDNLRHYLEVCQWPHKKGAVSGPQIPSDQALAGDMLPSGGERKKGAEKGAEKGAAIAPRSYDDDSGSLGSPVAGAQNESNLRPSFYENKSFSEAPAERQPHRPPGSAEEDMVQAASGRPSLGAERGLNLREPPAVRSAGASLVKLEGFASKQIGTVDLPDAAALGALADRAIAVRRQRLGAEAPALSPDATELLALIETEGGIVSSGGPTRMGWAVTRYLRAEAELRSVRLTRLGLDGRTVLVA